MLEFHPTISVFRKRLQSSGLNLLGTISLETYRQNRTKEIDFCKVWPQAQSILIIGNGGGEFWCQYRKFCHQQPDFLKQSHPLDTFTRQIIEQTARVFDEAGVSYHLFYPFYTEPVWFPFVTLAKLAGLGTPSPLGMLVHPTYGPWIAFRAGVLLPFDVPESPLDLQGKPCEGCLRYCLQGCRGNAADFSKDRIDLERCITFRKAELPCRATCHARLACPVGEEYRYPEDEIRYHYTFPLTLAPSPQGGEGWGDGETKGSPCKS
ncbi:MAG: hypothetical protein HY538_03625 [Deltaproteobacteria bacterium]|nr:hypothetical protein [Deltaproteobacteria bacterium]